MRIKRICASGYLPFQTAGIEVLEAEFPQSLTSIIGQNGCGKSALLALLSSPVAKRNDFSATDSMWQLEVEHHGQNYLLETDFKDKGYRFVLCGENLNKSGNGSIQVELAATHFGYTAEIAKLVTMQYNICGMSKKERQDFLMHFNPYDLNILLAYHRNVAKKVRELKTTTKHLKSRQVLLEADLLSEDKRKALEAQVTLLQEEKAVYEKLHKDITEQLDSTGKKLQGLGTSPAGVTQVQIDRLMADIASALHGAGVAHIESTGVLRYLTERYQQLHPTYTTMLAAAESLASDIHRYEALKEHDQHQLVIDMTMKVNSIDETLALTILDPVWSSYATESLTVVASEVLGILGAMVIDLTEAGTVIWPTSVYDKMTVKVVALKGEYQLLEKRFTQANSVILEQEKLILELQRNSYPNECNLPKCSFRSNLDAQVLNLYNRQKAAQQYIDTHTPRYMHLKRILFKLTDKLEAQSSYRSLVRTLESLYGKYPALEETLGSSFLRRMAKTPAEGKAKLNNLQESIQRILNYRILQQEKQRIMSHLEAIDTTQLPTHTLIEEIITDKTTQLVAHQRQLLSLEEAQEELTSQIAGLTQYEDKYAQLVSLYDQHRLHVTHKVTKLHGKLLTIIQQFLKERLEEVQTALWSVHTLFKTQTSLYTRLYEEILPSLQESEVLLHQYQELESALSPTSGIPYDYLRYYINQIIRGANAILKKVWSYNLLILPIEKGEELTFTFRRRVHNNIAKDIANCSLSQKDIINLAWSLSMISILGYGKQYPLQLDEPDAHFDVLHRERLVSYLNDQIVDGVFQQVFLVNHYADVSSGLVGDTICLKAEGISTPLSYNEFVRILTTRGGPDELDHS